MVAHQKKTFGVTDWTDLFVTDGCLLQCNLALAQYIF